MDRVVERCDLAAHRTAAGPSGLWPSAVGRGPTLDTAGCPDVRDADPQQTVPRRSPRLGEASRQQKRQLDWGAAAA